MEKDELPFLSNFGFMLTYKCTIACPHCIVKAGPHRKEEMKLEDALQWLDAIKAFGGQEESRIGISLTGGEPFYNIPLLKQVTEYAGSLGFIVSVVTNAYWAETKEKALKVLSGLDAVNMVSVSTDLYHQVSIPFTYVKNAIYACKKLDRIYNVAVATESEQDEQYLKLIDDILEITEKENIQTAFIVPVGRAALHADKDKFNELSEPTSSACSMASFPILFPNGDVIACIGPPIVLPAYTPLYLGNLRKESLEEILARAESNLILHAIRTFGPKMLVDLLKENGYSGLLPSSYMAHCPCDVCFKLFSTKEICEALAQIFEDDYLKKKVAYGRFYYLEETAMLEKMDIPGFRDIIE
jgi:MoaA/NifB/PqqE/SkfB family radical SAM enzyme